MVTNQLNMRPIEFAAYDVRNKKIVENALALSETQQLVTVNADYFNSPFSFFDGCRWMAYTGIKDRLNQKIHEHNKLIWDTGMDGEEDSFMMHEGEVVYKEGAFCFQSTGLSASFNLLIPLRDMNPKELEIFGHIYQDL